MSVLEMKEGNIARLTINVAKDAFVKALNDAYHKTASRYPVPGFRKGKAPRKVIEANYGAMVFYDASSSSHQTASSTSASNTTPPWRSTSSSPWIVPPWWIFPS